MKLIQWLLLITLMLVASTALAARQDKTLICHVGNEEGPNGEVYDPNCVPEPANGYFCADAGKIDLILVARRAKHLGNPAHEYDGIFDYEPGDVGASGDGTEDSNGDGIDDGCEPSEDCPCFDGIADDTPYSSYAISSALPCPVGSQSDTQFGGVHHFLFGTDYDVAVRIAGFCDGTFEYSCEGGPAGTFTLSQWQYEQCDAGPGWPPTIPD
jgi:hypothetical protein